MRALKGLVVGLGLLIVVMMGLVVWGVLRQAKEMDVKDGPYEASLALASGCAIDEILPAGEERMIVRLRGEAADCRQILVVSLRSGEVLGRITPRTTAQ